MALCNGVLKTPCGDVFVTDENNAFIPFSIQKNSFDCPYEFESMSGMLETIMTDTNYSLVIDGTLLKHGIHYRIFLSGAILDYGDSDEGTECVSGCSNGYCIAIGAYSPNDNEKMDQAYAYSKKMGFLEHRFIQAPPKYDESKFIKYDIEMLEDNSGFSFHLIDDDCSEIVFKIAWIRSKPGDELHYEGAVQFWTT